jgi:hypothetical protein
MSSFLVLSPSCLFFLSQICTVHRNFIFVYFSIFVSFHPHLMSDYSAALYVFPIYLFLAFLMVGEPCPFHLSFLLQLAFSSRFFFYFFLLFLEVGCVGTKKTLCPSILVILVEKATLTGTTQLQFSSITCN